MKLLNVKHQEGFLLHVHFEDDVEGVIDLTELVQVGVFIPLQAISLFAKAYNTGYSIAWSDDLEIDALNVYLQITGKSLQEINQSTLVHATD